MVKSIDSWEMHGKQLIINVPKEFSFTENLNYLSRSTNECLFQIKDQKIYRALPLEQATPVIEISSEHEETITIRFLDDSTSMNISVLAEVASYVRDWFDLDTDMRPFYELSKEDVLLARAAQEFYGLRIIGIPDLFEAISWGIIGQQINLAFAYTLKRRFVESFGKHVECEGNTYWLFPTPQDIANLSVEDLLALQMTKRKCEYLINVAQQIVEGKLNKEKLLLAGELKKAEKLLTNIRGIGPWTANYVLMRCLRFPSAFPIDDVGLHNAIKFVLNMDRKPTKEEILNLSASWANWESYATFYLWRFLY